MNHVTIKTPNQKDRNAITYWVLLPGGVYRYSVYKCIYVQYLTHVSDQMNKSSKCPKWDILFWLSGNTAVRI